MRWWLDDEAVCLKHISCIFRAAIPSIYSALNSMLERQFEEFLRANLDLLETCE